MGHDPGFPIQGGDMGELIRAKDWSTSPLGPATAWPAVLRQALNLMLNSPESMYLLWGSDLTFFFNDAYRPILGPRFEGALGQAVKDLWADAWEAVRPSVERALAGRHSRFENMPITMARYGAEEKTWWSFSFSPIHEDDGRVGGVFCYTRETTKEVTARQADRDEHIRLEQRIAQSTQERDRMWSVSRDLLLIINRDGFYSALNPSWRRELGYEPSSLIGLRFDDLVHPDDHQLVNEAFVALLNGAPTVEIQARLRCQDGTYRLIEWDAVAADNAFYCAGRDITEQRGTEDALRQSQKMEAVGQLTGGVAHDFNNLLTIIRSSVDLLKRPELPEERRRRYLDAVSDTVDRAAKLTSQLLAFARRQTLKAEVFDVGKRLQTIGDMLDTLTGARIRVELALPDEACFARADPSQFETALVNMVVNARDAMDGEGRLRLQLKAVPSMPAIRGHGAAAHPFVAVSLSDTGEGIAPDALGRIFEPFFTTKEVGKGTGLGLSQVFGFAKQSGGDIDVESEIGQGTTFTLYLPRLSNAAISEAGPEDEIGPSVSGAGYRVLVVEDNLEVGRFCNQILQDLGYATVWATNAEEALDKLGQDTANFDIVFSDVVMPGMGGIAMAKILSERMPSLPVILASGYSHVLSADEAHGFALLQKPYSADQVSAVLQKALRHKRYQKNPRPQARLD